MNWTWLGAATALLIIFSGYIGYQRGFIKEVVSTFLVAVTLIAVWFVNPYVNEFLQENTSLYQELKDGCREFVGARLNGEETIGEEEQESLIDSLPLPASLKKGIFENNNSEVYRFLSVDTFNGYVAGYLAKMLLNGISFLLSYLLVTILIRTFTFALNLAAHLPVIHGVNKAAGIFVGAAKGIIFVWIAFLVMTIFYSTPIGETCMEMIEGDVLLSFLYEKDIFVNIFLNIF